MRFPSSRTTDLRSASTPMLASCGRKCRMVLQTASCRGPRLIRLLACASSSEAKLGQYNASQLRAPGSLQIENGVNSSARDGDRVIDGTNTRLRAGIANCLEFLVDTPTYFANVRSPQNSGFSDVAPALKWQISPVPGKIDLSAVFGVALPTGTANIASAGAQPYLQFPWSWELRHGWGLSGMFTEFFRPSDPTSKGITETTFVIEKKVTERASLFVEYVGDYPESGSPAQFLNSGGLYRLSPNQQLDFHVALGLNHNAPSYVVGVGYSVRFDELFSAKRSASIPPRKQRK